MRKITFLMATLLCSVVAFGQMYYQPPAPGNPGNLNTDDEFPNGGGLDASWSQVQGPSSTPVWSSNQTVPFTFNFNGSARTSYKVSTTGILTFTTTATSVPTSTAAALPSTNIPDNSVCVWGIEATGSNDYVMSKTFGSAPNRQHWIFFASNTNPTNAQSWTYWSIVLEETTDKVYIVDQRHSSPPAVSLGVQFSSTSAVSVTGSPNIAAVAGTDPSAADNIHYSFIPGVQPQYDLSATALDMNDVEDISGAPFSIKGTFQNLGSATLTGFTLNYTINGGNIVASPVTANLASYASGSFTHATAWTPAQTGVYTVKLWASDLNGTNPDANNANDTITKEVIIVSNAADRVVIIEEKTGTWCGWCPRGAVGMDYMHANYPNSTATIAVHNGDPMVVPDYDGNIGSVAPGGYPGSAVDRVLGPDPNSTDLENAYNERRAVATYVEVMKPEFVSYNWATRELKVKVKAKFAANITGNYRMNLVLTEDNVTGTGSGYDQANYYSGGAQGPMGGYESKPNPVPASDMVYDHVARAIVGGFEGLSGVIPTTVVENTVYEHTFTYILTGTESIMDFTAVGIVTKEDTKEVLNANSQKMSTEISVDENFVNSLLTVKVAPNPVSDFATVILNLNQGFDISYDLVNAMGQVVMSADAGHMLEGDNRISLDASELTPGMYILNVRAGEYSISKKIIVE